MLPCPAAAALPVKRSRTGAKRLAQALNRGRFMICFVRVSGTGTESGEASSFLVVGRET
jgi:hypothetical protein